MMISSRNPRRAAWHNLAILQRRRRLLPEEADLFNNELARRNGKYWMHHVRLGRIKLAEPPYNAYFDATTIDSIWTGTTALMSEGIGATIMCLTGLLCSFARLL